MDALIVFVLIFVGGGGWFVFRQYRKQNSLTARQRNTRAQLKSTDSYLQELDKVTSEAGLDELEQNRNKGRGDQTK